jgi:hypothetical protein
MAADRLSDEALGYVRRARCKRTGLTHAPGDGQVDHVHAGPGRDEHPGALRAEPDCLPRTSMFHWAAPPVELHRPTLPGPGAGAVSGGSSGPATDRAMTAGGRSGSRSCSAVVRAVLTRPIGTADTDLGIPRDRPKCSPRCRTPAAMVGVFSLRRFQCSGALTILGMSKSAVFGAQRDGEIMLGRSGRASRALMSDDPRRAD